MLGLPPALGSESIDTNESTCGLVLYILARSDSRDSGKMIMCLVSVE